MTDRQKYWSKPKWLLLSGHLPAETKTNKTIIVAHGYHEGSSVDRASGKSGGRFITFGWLKMDQASHQKRLTLIHGENFNR